MSAVIETIKSCVLFSGFSEGDLKKVADSSKSHDLNPGQALFFENDASSALFIVARGTLAIRKASKAGDEGVTQVGSSNVLGEMGLLSKTGSVETRSATAEATEPSQVLEISYSGLDSMFKVSPNAGHIFYRNLAVMLAGRIRRTTEDLAGLRALRLRHT